MDIEILNILYSPRFSTDWFISRMLRVYLDIRLVATVLMPSPPGDCIDWGLWRLMVGRRATNDALCLKLDDALLRIGCFFLVCIFFFFSIELMNITKKKIWKSMKENLKCWISTYFCVWLYIYNWKVAKTKKQKFPKSITISLA